MTKPSNRKSKKGDFLAGYSEGASFLKPDKKVGRPGLTSGKDPEGREVLIKSWPSAKLAGDQDLAELWRSEIRQLQRLAALPNAEELVPMVSSGRDTEGYYLVLDPGRGSPLAVLLDQRNRHSSLIAPRQPRNRIRHWANAKRLVLALDLLHSQGSIHRSVDAWSVVTALDEEPDFRLTGFEWSMRVASIEHERPLVKVPAFGGGYASFARDWQSLGTLIGQLLAVSEKRLSDQTIVPSDVAENFSSAEATLLRSMLGLQASQSLDADNICSRIDQIILSVSSEAAGHEAQYCLSVQLGRNSRLAEAIRSVAPEIEISDEEDQNRFIADDLSQEPFFSIIQEPDSINPRFALLGKQLTYRLQPYREPSSAGEATWEFASCDRADRGRPPPGFIKGAVAFDVATLTLVSARDAAKIFARRRGRVARWNELIAKSQPKQFTKTERDSTHQALALLLLLEMAHAVADVFPVQTMDPAPADAGDRYLLAVTFRSDPDRAELSQILGIRSPAVRFREMLASEDLSEEGAWVLSEAGILGDRSSVTEWRFQNQSDQDGVEVLWFEGPAPHHVRGPGFFTPAGMIGRTSQFKRRIKALKGLRDHSELLGMLVDPRLRLQESQDSLDESDDQFKEMDLSKQQALREIFSTVPIFLLQGPPGVGKTYLVGDLVRRRFTNETTTRMLLSAQSNSAIDHLMDEVKTVFEKSAHDPLMVRARAADDDAPEGALELDKQTQRILGGLNSSQLVSETLPAIREKLKALHAGSAKRTAAEIRALQGMILRAANLVFATTNSAAIERLIDEGALFDWTIIEEAGKATGGELLSPLLLSNRRLMIGDHKQLPPYGADKMIPLLSRVSDVKDALLLCEELISRHLKDPATEELFDEIEDNLDFGAVCSRAILLLQMFETFVERELERQKNRAKGMPIARRLSEQRRMHPAIAKIVSDCFYEGKLKTNAQKEKLYREGEPPAIGSFLGKQFKPVTFVNLPYVRSNPNYRGGEKRPPWQNPKEADAVISVLAALRANPRRANPDVRPNLAVLSPYREQIKLIGRKIDQNLAGSLRHLTDFASPFPENGYCGTVDSFQGDEADVVVVSLVRNNSHSTPIKALGFLQDTRRTNVLLSRAKWKLIIVGSLEFFQQVVELSSGYPDQDIVFLRQFLESLNLAVQENDAVIIDVATQRGAAK